MKRHLLAATAIVAMLPAIPATAQVVGVTSAVRNDVRLRKPNTPVARPVMLKQRISIGELVQTGAKSQMQLVLLDRSIFTVGANARLTIDRYVYDPARNNRSMDATVGKGAFRFMSGRRTTGTTRINTPTAAIGVRGTIVEGVVGPDAVLIANGERGVGRGVRADPNTASLIILRGPGAATTANVLPGVIDVTSGGRTVTVDRPMQAVYIPYPGATPIGPFTISNAGLHQVQALLAPSVAQRLGLSGPVDPNRTFAPTPDIDDQPRTGPRGFPARPGRGPEGPEPGAPTDGPPGTGADLPLPLGPLRGFQPPPPRQNGPRQQPSAAPSAAPQPRDPAPSPNGKAPTAAPTPAPTPTGKVPGAAPTPAPTPAPPPSLKAPQNPNFAAPTPSPSPTPRPTPTPSPNQKPPGKPSDAPPPKTPG
ncbi:MAG: FecR domain-containing protein [Sphingomonas sp.]